MAWLASALGWATKAGPSTAPKNAPGVLQPTRLATIDRASDRLRSMLHPSSYGYPRSITSRAGPATRRKSGSPGERPQAGRGTLASAGAGISRRTSHLRTGTTPRSWNSTQNATSRTRNSG